jgi:hypothetical protein
VPLRLLEFSETSAEEHLTDVFPNSYDGQLNQRTQGKQFLYAEKKDTKELFHRDDPDH